MQLQNWVHEEPEDTLFQRVKLQHCLKLCIFLTNIYIYRHGIDLDSPGTAGSQASLLAAAAQQSLGLDGALNSLGQLSSGVSVSVTGGGGGYSDSGDSNGARSTDNATPPMHFLTPHVEISMADAPVPVFSPTPVSTEWGNCRN